MRPMRSAVETLFNKAPVKYVSTAAANRGLLGAVIRSASSERQMSAMGDVSTLFAIVNRTSNSTAQVDWKLWRKSDSGKDEDRVEVTAHPALSVWNKPNPFYTRQEFVEAIQQHIDLTGEAWWLIGRNDELSGIPLELWPIRPDKMEPIPSPTEYLSGYVYRSPDGEQVPLNLDEVIQLKMPNPLDPYRGMGPVQALLTSLDSSRYTEEWNRNFFINSAEPGGIVELENTLSDDEFNQFNDRWSDQHKGVARAHRVALLEGGAKWVQRTFSHRDMQFSELRKVNRDTQLEAFGMPRSIIGITEDVNRANAEAAEVTFARRLIVPRLERIKGVLNNDFLSLFGILGQGVEFDYENPVPEDRDAENAERTSRVNSAVALVAAGWNPEDAAAAMGLPQMRFEGRREANNGTPVGQ